MNHFTSYHLQPLRRVNGLFELNNFQIIRVKLFLLFPLERGFNLIAGEDPDHYIRTYMKITSTHDWLHNKIGWFHSFLCVFELLLIIVLKSH